MPGLVDCRQCERLDAYRLTLKQRYPDYHCRPVPAFGSSAARLLIVGLAPGLHGANASGRPFTGDASGDLLFDCLHRHGLASASQSRHCDDGLQLRDCRITNAVKCVPPGNLPTATEKATCNRYLVEEVEALPQGGVILTLGGVAHRMTLQALGLRAADYPFGHANCYRLPTGSTLLSSYHPSRYNINTGRLSAAAFDAVIETARGWLQ